MEQPVYGLQLPGLGMQGEAITTLENLASLFLSQIRQVQPVGPYRLAGYSLGSCVAFEMAQQLRAQGQELELLLFFDGFPFGALQPRPPRQRLLIHAQQLFRNRPHDAAAYALDRARSFAKTLVGRRTSRNLVPPAKPVTEDSELAESIRRVSRAAENAWQRYCPRHYPGTILLLQAMQFEDWMKFNVMGPANGWAELAARVEVCRVPGRHLTMFDKPNLVSLAGEVNRCLAGLADQSNFPASIPTAS